MFLSIIQPWREGVASPALLPLESGEKSKLRCAHLPKCTDKLAAPPRGREHGTERNWASKGGREGGDIKIQKGNATIMKE